MAVMLGYSLQLPQDLPKVSDILLQIILTRTMHVLVSLMKSAAASEETIQPQVAPLTLREQNAIRYDNIIRNNEHDLWCNVNCLFFVLAGIWEDT